jgi:hypothetical protein
MPPNTIPHQDEGEVRERLGLYRGGAVKSRTLFRFRESIGSVYQAETI